MKLLLFDFDGVIADSLDVVYNIESEVLAGQGLKIKSKDDFLKLYKKNWYESVKELGLSDEELKKVISETAGKLTEAYSDAEPFSGIKDALRKLKKKHKVVIITSSPGSSVEGYLKKNSFPAFEVLGAEQETSKVKKINLMKRKYPKAEIYYIGDTAGDIKEGETANVKTVAVVWGYHKKKTLLSENPDFIVNNPEELLELFT